MHDIDVTVIIRYYTYRRLRRQQPTFDEMGIYYLCHITAFKRKIHSVFFVHVDISYLTLFHKEVLLHIQFGILVNAL